MFLDTLVRESTVSEDVDQRPDQRPDQRKEQRHAVGHPAILSLVETPGLTLSGEIRDVSIGGTQIRLDQPVAPFTLVRIEYDDSLILGEIVYCLQDQSKWIMGIRAEHRLFGLTALAHSMQRF